MDKQRLTTLINQPEKLEEKDFNDLSNLKKEYPYFQALSPLITIGSKKYSPQSEKKHLQSAAIYALDRKHLKEILTKDYESQTVDEVKEIPQQQKDTAEEKNKVIGGPIEGHNKSERKTSTTSDSLIEVTQTPASSHLSDSFFEELFKEMEDLKAEKENYQKTLDRFEAKKSEEEKQKPKAKTIKKTTSKSGSRNTTAKTAAAKKPTSKPKPATTKKTSTTKKTTAAKTTTKKSSSDKSKDSTKKASTTKAKTSKAAEKKPKKDEHDIIEEITSRKELKISDAHKKEQLNIINNFIEKEPVLTKRIKPDNQSNKQEAEDLSASSTNLSDDVVSETLAKLMIKQGRKQKAIDIYKKLIWKFPQKKTYFVEIIDELKKES
ncbi:tetratricopeptide repeat protein [Marivirga salinae]|uniref:Tetratricopeptide repeat protein n=1 Tax=Marivirga salinarum TaxID=3059078 RepID=A0AA51N9X6_9BACT|nr:tetratricopeptide repeat protein [Marivirga sp. BDSF4-3]WMN11258.1 tetratricopeptide repeat protein [Marivirga sp. BDSF4-3]